MPDLQITFIGMALVGHGDQGRTEAWLVDTIKVPAGGHIHSHRIVLGGGIDPLLLRGGVLVSFVDGGKELNGPIDMSSVAANVVDLDALMPASPLRGELTGTPAAGGPWTNLLAAWIRLPGGTVNAKIQTTDTWPFPSGPRTLSEEMVITVPGVQKPVVRITTADGKSKDIKIPSEEGRYNVEIRTVFDRTHESAQEPELELGSTFKLDELTLLYGCLTNSAGGPIPERPFTAADVRRTGVEFSIQSSVCPIGMKWLPLAQQMQATPPSRGESTARKPKPYTNGDGDSDSDLRLEPESEILKGLDPSLQNILLEIKSGKQPDPSQIHTDRSGEVRVDVLAVLKNPGITVPGFHVAHVVGDVATGTVEVGDIEKVRLHGNVVSLKAARKLQPDVTISVPEIRANAQALAGVVPPGTRIDGSNVIVGIIDSGCDFAHRDFINPDGTTRIKFLWDQRSQGPTSMTPAGFTSGREFTAAHLQQALASSDPYQALAYDPGIEAHGTHVMGIAASNGRGSGRRGVAPNADIIFVQLSATSEVLGEGTFGNSRQLVEAASYIFQKAAALGKPAVVNISLGTNGGPHDGSTPVERALDTLLETPGRAIVISAGNSFDDRCHASGTVSSTSPRTLAWEKFESDGTTNEIEIWYDGLKQLALTLVSPSGTRLGPVSPGETFIIRRGGQEVGRIIHRRQDPLNQDNQVDVILDEALPHGVWRVELSTSGADVPFHAWIERDDDRRSPVNPLVILREQSRFVSGSESTTHTLGSISCGHLPIVVGSYDATVQQRDLSPFSAAGPTRDGRQKPEISAPGQNVLSARSRSQTGVVDMSGTSMAAPHVTGVIALLMQAAGRPLTSARIRELLSAGARIAPQQPQGWHPRYGFGRVDAAAVVQAQLAPAPVPVETAALSHVNGGMGGKSDAAVHGAPPIYALEHLIGALANEARPARFRVKFECEVEPLPR